MTNVEVIRVTQASDLADIPTTEADILLIFDRATTVAVGTLPFPLAPIKGQSYLLSSKIEITSFSVNTGGKDISGVPAILPIGVIGWVYEAVSDEWFPLHNPPISTAAQTALNSKLATNGNGGSLTGITKTQVGLANVDNTADANKPISSSQQAALDTKLGVGTIANVVYSRVTGSNATTTGQVLVDIPGLSNALVANAVYEFEAVMSCSTSAVTTGISYGVQFSAAGATIEANIVAASSTTATKAERINAFNTNTTAFLATSAQAGGVNIRGIIATGANPGNLTIQHRKITSGTSTVFINSMLRTIRIL
jgi:hypothetical protein